MKRIIFITEAIKHYGKNLGGTGVASFSLIQEFKKENRLKVLTLGFKGQPNREYIDNVEVIRINTFLSKKCEGFRDLFSYQPVQIKKTYYIFGKKAIKYIRKMKEPREGRTIAFIHGINLGFLCKYLKEMGYKVFYVFQFYKFQRNARGLFLNNHIDLSYELKGLSPFHRMVLGIIKRIFKDERQLVKFIYFLYKFPLKYLFPLDIRLYYDSEIEALNYIDKIIVLCKNMKSYFSWINPYDINNKIEIIGNGVEEDFFVALDNKDVNEVRDKYGLKKEDIVLLFVGRIEPAKGLEYLVDSMHYIERDSSLSKREIKLIISGETYGIFRTYPQKLVNLSKALKKIKVFFVGPVYDKEKLALYDVSNVFILPSVYEPFGIVVLEAMARGKPVIVSDCCGVADIVSEHFGIVVDYDNFSQRAENLGMAIKNILQMDFSSMGHLARKKAERYKWTEVAKKYQKIYDLL